MNCGISQDSILYSLYIEVWIPYMAGEKDLLNKSCSPAIFKHLIDPILIALSWLTISPLSPVFPSAHPFIHLNTLLRRFKLNPMCSVHPKLLLICQARSVCVCVRVWRECTCRIVTALADRFQYAQSFTMSECPQKPNKHSLSHSHSRFFNPKTNYEIPIHFPNSTNVW